MWRKEIARIIDPPPVHMIKLTKEPEIDPCLWVLVFGCLSLGACLWVLVFRCLSFGAARRGGVTGARYRFRQMRSRASPSKAARGWPRLPRGIHRIRSHDCAWYVHLPSSRSTSRLPEQNYRHDAQSKGLRAAAERSEERR